MYTEYSRTKVSKIFKINKFTNSAARKRSADGIQDAIGQILPSNMCLNIDVVGCMRACSSTEHCMLLLEVCVGYWCENISRENLQFAQSLYRWICVFLLFFILLSFICSFRFYRNMRMADDVVNSTANQIVCTYKKCFTPFARTLQIEFDARLLFFLLLSLLLLLFVAGVGVVVSSRWVQ